MTPEELAAQAAAAADAAVAAERTRTNEIHALAAEHGITDAARVSAWISAGTSVSAVGLDILRTKKPPAALNGSVTVGAQRETEKPFATFGDYIGAAYRAEMNPTALDPRLLPLKAAGIGLQEGLGSDGGFLVPVQFATSIMERAFIGGEIMKRVRKIPMQANRYMFPAVDETSRATGSRWGGIRGYWQGEGDTAVASKPKFRQGVLDLKKLTVLSYVTEEQMEDASATATILEQGFSEEVVFLTETAIFEGLGAGQPLGFMNSAALVTQAAEGGQVAGTINQANLSKMWARLWARSRNRAVWLLHQDAEAQLDGLLVGTTPVYMPPGGISEAPFGRIKGRDVIVSEYNAAVGTPGDIVLVDLDQYILGERRGMDLQRSMHVRFLQGEQAFRLTYRVDGQPIWSNPLTPNKGANTISPFVALAQR